MLGANPNFARLWLGESVSLVGSRMTEFALPMVGLLLLRVSPGELGVLSAIQFGSIAAAAVPAGAIVDRCRTREVVVATNVGRAIIYASVLPLAATGALSFEILCALALAGGALTGVFDVAYVAFLPELVPEKLLVGANARLEGSASVGEICGQGLGGVVVQILGAPLALFFDALTYVFSAGMLLGIHRERSARVPLARSSPWNPWADLRVGLRAIWPSRALKALMVQSAWLNTLLQAIVVALPIYVLRTLGMGPMVLGAALAAGSVGALIGCTAAGRIHRRYGIQSALVLGMSLACCAQLLLPLCGGQVLAALTIGAGFAIYGFGLAVFNVLSLTLRMSSTPPELLGRTVAAYRLVSWGGMPVGALFGGVLAGALGARATLLVVAAGLSISAVAFALYVREPGSQRALPVAHGVAGPL
jgi:MFS family permease